MKLGLNRTLAWSFALMLPVCAGAMAADVFDKPLDKQVVKLPADSDNPQAKPKRSCFTYPGFMVKEVDLGEVGADELSITPISKGGQKPFCGAKTANEIVIKGDDWSGYFEGVKGDFVFFTAEEGVNGGMLFAVFSGGNGKKLFEELAGTELFRAVGRRHDHALSQGAQIALLAVRRSQRVLAEDHGGDAARGCREAGLQQRLRKGNEENAEVRQGDSGNTNHYRLQRRGAILRRKADVCAADRACRMLA